ncbi:hypothetical protein [Mycolicibacterium sp. CH28]|uniref:hypothetical protein n=1 Tax=Mycolicibacterium sp. CH28 TaxID=2512237 RepID=UPI0013A5DBAE|nr:hypothetical protein [Mycolicibacterium sp. CH28]
MATLGRVGVQRLIFTGHIAGSARPPVGFGFSSAPPTPQIVSVTTIDMPVSVLG